MNYNEFINKILAVKRFGQTPNLLVVEKILAEFDNPHKHLKFIHIAGTNGKGSVSGYIAASLQEAGFKTGLFTSPYIDRFNERFKINGKEIEDGILAEIGTDVFNTAEKLNCRAKQFDIVTAIAMIYFNINKCDYVVLECGMGGRNDSTNIITPAVSVITTINYDHTEVFGKSISDIAYEKAGIIKEEAPVFCEPFKYDIARKIIENEVKNHNTVLTVCQSAEIITVDNKGSSFNYKGKKYRVNMCGEHQVVNAALAIDVLEFLGVKYKKIYKGISNMFLTGRLERLSEEPLIYVDGGHNPEGAEALKKAVSYHKLKNVVFVISMLKNKDIKKYIDTLGRDSEFIITAFSKSDCHNPKSVIEGLNLKNATEVLFENLYEKIMSKKDKNYIICGSLYQISQIKTEFCKSR